LRIFRLAGGDIVYHELKEPIFINVFSKGDQICLDKAAEQLQNLLDNESAKPEDIEKQLAAYRTAREKVKKEPASEQQKLQKQVTVRQKARLVLMGLLE